MTESSQYSLLQWLGPELAREGLLRNEDWVTEHTDRAAALFDPKSRLSTIAVMMAAIHPRSIDYIEQAPVLVASAAAGFSAEKPKERLYVAMLWRGKITDGPKLRDLLKSSGFVQQHRDIKGKALKTGTSFLGTLRLLAKMPPSALAQSIPTTIRKQRYWLETLTEWQQAAKARFNDPSLYLDWAASALSSELNTRPPIGSAAAIIDFAGVVASGFNRRWSWKQAEAAKNRWHEELARASQEKGFLLRYNIGWEEQIDYGALPTATEIDGFHITALNTGAALFAEGRTMHHCVASYTREVVMGKCFIFSVRIEDRRYATFELRSRYKGHYELQQLKGPCNSVASAAIRSAVYKFVDSCNRIPISAEMADLSKCYPLASGGNALTPGEP